MPEGLGDLGDAELVVVAQHEAVALAERQGRAAHRGRRCWSSRPTSSILDRAHVEVVARRLVAQRHEAPAVVVAGEVEHDRAEVGDRALGSSLMRSS